MRLAFATAILVLLVPAASAQAPGAQVFVILSPTEQTLVLDENGRGQADFSVQLMSSGVTCATPARVTLALGLDPFPTFSGAAVKPPTASWDLPPGPFTTTNESRHAVVVAWDVDAAPANATQQYQISIGPMSWEGGPCAPSSTVRQNRAATVLACMPPSAHGPSGEYCQPGDNEESSTARFDGDSRTPQPAIGMVLAAVLLGGFLSNRRGGKNETTLNKPGV